uniref:Uncharacterized protein n=1 Tax=Rhizophagus irregularis (strain DAOM 181602 / DAOM 197198 / MUCL 43194) TaxID=747089 RepID=U9UM56_RHIID
MKECWNSDPDKRSTATDVYTRIKKMCENERKSYVNKYPTKIIESSDIGPITTNNPGRSDALVEVNSEWISNEWQI